MKIISLQIGKPKTVTFNGRSVETGIFKDPVPGPLFLKRLGLEGDGQADLSVHGGVEKALYMYGLDAYSYWEKLRPNDKFSFGAFGENLCMDELNEKTIFVGNTYELGESIIEVSEPRFPCFKLGIMYNDQSILRDFMDSGRPGIYFRVLKEGKIGVGDQLKLLAKDPNEFSVFEFFLAKQKKLDNERLKVGLSVASMSPEWKQKLQRQLNPH